MKKIAFDASSVMWTSLKAGADKENGYKVLFEEKEVQINSAAYGLKMH